MRRAWGWLVLGLAGCYAVPSQHQVGEPPGEADSGQAVEPIESDGSDDRDAASELDAGLADAALAGDDAQTEAGPSCSCTDPEAPICIEATALCVQCLEARDCAVGEYCLVATGDCVGCLEASHCAGQASASYCDPAANACTACRDGIDADCSNVPGLGVCQAGTCVQCAGTRRDACGETAAACSTSFKCERCKADADCQRFQKVCDEPTGQCVSCTVDSEATQCGGKSCNPATHTCTQTDRASVDLCSTCVADSECKADHRCIPMNFKGAARGGYCMKRLSSGCSRPFGATLIKRASLSGAAAEDYCGIAEASTSCEAVLALLLDRGCVDGQASQCGAEGAVCGDVSGFTRRCSYTCETSSDCPANSPCPVAGMDRYCGKP
jgi:hypothetical protein